MYLSEVYSLMSFDNCIYTCAIFIQIKIQNISVTPDSSHVAAVVAIYRRCPSQVPMLKC